MASIQVNALSADRDFLSRLRAQNFQASVHSQFNKVINLYSYQDNQLYTLACRSLDNAPNTLIVDLDGFRSLVLTENIPLVLTAHQLQLGDILTINLSACLFWLPPAIRYRYCRMSSTDYLFSLSKEITQRIIAENKDSPFYYDGNNIFYRALSQQLISTSERLIDGIKQASESEIADALAGLIGLGTGLTPSGDDYLLGLCAVLALPGHPGCGWLPLIEQVIRASESRTTKISHMALLKAVQGKTREHISVLLTAIFSERSAPLGGRIGAVLNIGSSSGADILSGIVAGLLLSIYLEKQNANQDLDQKKYLF